MGFDRSWGLALLFVSAGLAGTSAGCDGGRLVPGRDAGDDAGFDAMFSRPDSGMPPPNDTGPRPGDDTGVPPDDAAVVCTGVSSRTFDVDVIGGIGYPQPTAATPLAGAAVRVAHVCGVSMEGVTDAAGHVTITLDGPADGWAITAAKAGYSAVSVLDLAASPVGALRLDRYGVHTFTGLSVSGTLTGVTSGDSVTIDSYDFDTIYPTANGPWSTMFYAGGPSGAPLLLAAFEMDGAGHLVSFATTTRDPRPTVAVTGVALAFPATAPTPIVTTVTIDGLLDGAPTAGPPSVIQYPGADLDGAYITAGVAVATSVSGGTATFSIEHVAALEPSYAFLPIDGASIRTTYVVRDFSAGATSITAPTAIFNSQELISNGRNLYGAWVNAADGPLDALVMHIDEGGNHGPRWRVYCSPTSHGIDAPCFVPRLPSTVSLADLGIDPAAGAVVIAMMQTAHAGSLWTNSGLPFPSAYYDWQLALAYQTFPPTVAFWP